jgi:DNA-binding NarL/FixJ family response regulator
LATGCSIQGLHQIVVRPHLEAEDPVAVVGAGGEHQHRNILLRVSAGKAMWSVLKNHQIDLIVLDIMMPGEDGLTLCRQPAGAISRFFQIVDNQFPDVAVVIDDQDVVNTLQRMPARRTAKPCGRCSKIIKLT